MKFATLLMSSSVVSKSLRVQMTRTSIALNSLAEKSAMFYKLSIHKKNECKRLGFIELKGEIPDQTTQMYRLILDFPVQILHYFLTLSSLSFCNGFRLGHVHCCKQEYTCISQKSRTEKQTV